MMGWIFAGITLGAVFFATFLRPMKGAILALWVAGLGVGVIYLNLGAELLAIIQWIVSTLVTISFIFFSVMFGEYHSIEPGRKKNEILHGLLGVCLGAGFAGTVWLGTQSFSNDPFHGPLAKSDLIQFGKDLTQNHLLSLEVMGLMLFLVLVGGGVVARSEKGESK